MDLRQRKPFGFEMRPMCTWGTPFWQAPGAVSAWSASPEPASRSRVRPPKPPKHRKPARIFLNRYTSLRPWQSHGIFLPSLIVPSQPQHALLLLETVRECVTSLLQRALQLRRLSEKGSSLQPWHSHGQILPSFIVPSHLQRALLLLETA